MCSLHHHGVFAIHHRISWPLLILAFAAVNLSAQHIDSLQKIDIDWLRQQSYLTSVTSIDCDSTSGTRLELRICANLRLQREDSLLQWQVTRTREEYVASGRSYELAAFDIAQQLWERFRYYHCSSQLIGDYNLAANGETEDFSSDGSVSRPALSVPRYSITEMILFMECAADLTEQRRRSLE